MADVTVWAAGLDRALRRAGIPIVGVTIGAVGTRGSWAIVFLPEATPAQRTQAVSILATYDADTDVTIVNELAQADLDVKAIKAVAIWTAQKLSIPLATMKAEVLAIYKSLP